MESKRKRTTLVAMLTALVVMVPGLALMSAAHGSLSSRARPNGRILVNEFPGISSIRPDGTGYRVLVDTIDDTSAATWSPDKSKFAYFHEEDGGFPLYVANADGTGRVNVAQPYPYTYSWSPDGRYIAYTGITRSDPIEGTCFGIYIVTVETLATREVTDGPDCRAFDVQWSPTGDELAVVDGWDSGEPTLDRDIYKVDVVSGELIRLTDSPAVDRAPRWSPDGRWLVFVSSRDRPPGKKERAGSCSRRTEIFRMRSDGSHQRRLSGNLSNPDCGPTWSSDGRHIAYVTFVKKDEDDLARPGVIRVMRKGGSGKLSLSDPRRAPSHSPDFSPDGRWVVFLSWHQRRRTSHFDLHKVRSDGSRRVRLTRGGKHAGGPDW